MKRRAAQTPLRLVTEISVTPLLDIALVILLIFIVAVPLMRNAPTAAAGSGPPADVAVLALDEKPEVRIEGQAVPAEGMEDAFRGLKEARPHVAVRIEASGDLPVSRLMPVMDALSAAGIEKTTVETKEAAK